MCGAIWFGELPCGHRSRSEHSQRGPPPGRFPGKVPARRTAAAPDCTGCRGKGRRWAV